MDPAPPVLTATDVAVLYRIIEPDAAAHERANAARRITSLRRAGRLRGVKVGSEFRYLRSEAIGALERETDSQPLAGGDL